MPSDSRLFAQPRAAASVETTNPVRRWLRVAFLSPSLFVTGIVHVLCQPVVKRTLFAAVILDIPLQWGTHLEMREGAAASFGAMDGFDFSVTTLALVGLYIGWLFTERAEGRPLRVVWNWPIAAYTAAVVMSLFVATNLQLSYFQIYLVLEMFLLYLYFSANITSRDDILLVLRLILVGGIIEAAYILLLAAVGHEFAFVRALGFKSVIYVPFQAGEIQRFGGTVGGPNYAAAYLVALITLALAVRRMAVSVRLRRLTLPVMVLAPLALVLTLSRGGWIEAIVSIGIFFGAVWLKSGVTLKRMFTLGVTIVIVLLCLYSPNPISKRLTANDHGSAESRIPLMHLAYRVIAANPVLGVGANNFAAVMGDYEGPEFRHAWLYTVHNKFLLVWSETGIIGLAAFLWIYGSLIRRGWKLWKARDAVFAPLGLGIVAALFGILSHMLVDVLSGRTLLQLVWIMAALIGACELIQRSEAAEQARREAQQSQVQAA